ncbi:WD40 repeat domain-containing protein, partial [Candidatus Pacearchaeota archaeon]|nr:WD40 repeat domain-containing protein [Candidatus Pacearchaeota archaeon]
MIKLKTLLFILAPILLLITALAISPQLSVFNDGNFDKTLYTNKTSNVSISIAKNVTIIHASFNVTEVDLGVVNYEQIYNFYTLSVRNGTDEILAAGTRGYIAIINTTTGGIIYNVSNAISDYVIDSDFKEDGSEAILITASKNVLIYNASTKTITAYQPYGLSYLTGVSYSANDTYAIITSGASDPIAFYNATSRTFSNLSTNAGSTRCSSLSPIKDQAIVCTAGNIFWFNVSCALASIGTDNFGSCSSSISSFVGSTSGKACDVAYKPDGTEALVVCMNGVVYRYNDTARTIQNISINTANDLKGVSYSTTGDKAIITGESGKIFLYNTTTQVITALSSQYANNTNAVVFLNNTDAIIVGSGKSTLRYNSQYDGVNTNISTLRTGESGILYHLSFKPNTAEALIVGDDGQVFKYNLSSKQITYLTSPASVPFHDIAYNWNGSEALIVGKAGTVLKFNPSDNSFTQLNSSTNSSLTSVSYRNGTDTALIGGINNTLLIRNSSCDGTTNAFCKLTLSGNQNEKTIVAFNPSGSVALIGQLCNQFIYNSTTGNITGGSNWNSDGCIVTRGIAWKPDGTEALLVGRNAENDTCENAGYLTMIAVYNTTANNFTGAPACRNRADILEDVAYSSDGSEALLIGRNGILIKYNTTNANYNNLNPSLIDLSSGTTGTLFGVDYRRDNVTNEAILVVGDNKQILFYDGEKVMTSPEVFLDTARIWNFTGNYNTTTMINFTSNLTAYLQACSADSTGKCSVPFYVNATTQTSIMRFHDLNITYNNQPALLSSIPNKSWNQDTSTTINLTQYFNDSDADTLT